VDAQPEGMSPPEFCPKEAGWRPEEVQPETLGGQERVFLGRGPVEFLVRPCWGPVLWWGRWPGRSPSAKVSCPRGCSRGQGPMGEGGILAGIHSKSTRRKLHVGQVLWKTWGSTAGKPPGFTTFEMDAQPWGSKVVVGI
jgi:hypothetical protein